MGQKHIDAPACLLLLSHICVSYITATILVPAITISEAKLSTR